ncbi:hypothetical protein IRJ41_007376 [Triplophysa rosa]|uniref:Myb/SANT-like DNA-binding domain-containing protein n=1 Tax=Triplophysa rosa TaxID=992332 RepID=A0A9W7WDD0_TRIRA|nr:hypothetical protein IRJ41_007376 [Triplophysa rosa]
MGRKDVMMYNAPVIKVEMACWKQNWSATETTLLHFVKEQKIVERLDGCKSRNNELFKQVFEKLQEAGINRSVEQIKNRWKALKSGYYKAKSHNNKIGESPANFLFYNIMDEIMGERPLVTVAAHAVDVGFQVPEEDSLDGSASVTEDASGKKSSSGYAKLMQVWSAEQKSFLDRIEQHQERNQQRDEMLLSSLNSNTWVRFTIGQCTTPIVAQMAAEAVDLTIAYTTWVR